MKAQREAADKAMASKLKRLGASGDYKVNGKACGGKAYAAGGRVKGYAFGGAPAMGADTDMDGSGPSGPMPRANLGRAGRHSGKPKKAGSKAKGHTINIVNLGGGGGGDKGGPPMMPPGPLPGGPPGGMPPMPPKPPMPPMGAGPGGPPMPPGGGGPPMLRKNGGRIGRKFGGSIKMSGDAKPVGKSMMKKGC